MIEVAANMLLSLFTGGPKILVLRSEGADTDNAYPELPVDWIEMTALNGGETFLIGEIGDQRRPLEVPPSNVLAIWNPEDGISTGLLETWWVHASGSGDLPMFLKGGSERLVEAVAQKAIQENKRLTHLNQTLIEDLATFRQGLAHHVRIPPELEMLVKNLRKAPPQLVYETPSAGSSNSTITGALTQPLFVGARGFLGFDLRIEKPGAGKGHLLVMLRVPSSKQELSRWKIAFDEIVSGWLALRLEKVLSRMDSSLELLVQTEGEGVPPHLFTTSSGLMPEFAFHSVDHGNPNKQMLELRIWGGYPGLSYDSPSTVAASLAKMKIADHLISKAQTTRHLSWAYPYFGYMDGGRLLLRPLKQNPASAAKIDLPLFPGFSGVSCTAKIDDALCQTRLLVRVALSYPGQNVDDVESGKAAVASTDWVELAEPLKPFELKIGLPLPLNEPMELHLFSRLPTGGKLDHGKVVFGDFETILDECSAFSRPPYLPVIEAAS
ncbi:hypothetical protein JAU75_13175 [Ochrobactrum sp. Q0168]|uniref:DUF6212 domain-containing protein n=1 Tax=Ochrobactrum sp. Q0168 TaxID=2793241 RepID=UPI0018ED82C0|nr:hypothetical protein [Ochrobactrum sp. Q0168]